MTKQLHLPVLVLLISSSSISIAAQASGPCSTPTRLTNDEARILLYVTPAAVSARRVGTDVDIVKSAPSDEFPANDFFVAVLITQKPTEASVLGNGIFGYFAVDKRTGVVESLGDFTSVSGKELMRVQEWMCHLHGIQARRVGK